MSISRSLLIIALAASASLAASTVAAAPAAGLDASNLIDVGFATTTLDATLGATAEVRVKAAGLDIDSTIYVTVRSTKGFAKTMRVGKLVNGNWQGGTFGATFTIPAGTSATYRVTGVRLTAETSPDYVRNESDGIGGTLRVTSKPAPKLTVSVSPTPYGYGKTVTMKAKLTSKGKPVSKQKVTLTSTCTQANGKEVTKTRRAATNAKGMATLKAKSRCTAVKVRASFAGKKGVGAAASTGFAFTFANLKQVDLAVPTSDYTGTAGQAATFTAQVKHKGAPLGGVPVTFTFYIDGGDYPIPTKLVAKSGADGWAAVSFLVPPASFQVTAGVDRSTRYSGLSDALTCPYTPPPPPVDSVTITPAEQSADYYDGATITISPSESLAVRDRFVLYQAIINASDGTRTTWLSNDPGPIQVYFPSDATSAAFTAQIYVEALDGTTNQLLATSNTVSCAVAARETWSYDDD